MNPCRQLKDLPPLEFPISQENWAKYLPTPAEYELMVEAFERINGIDPEDELRRLFAELPAFRSEWDDDSQYDYSI